MESKDGLQPHEQFRALSRLYPVYRVGLAGFLMALFAAQVDGMNLGRFDSTLFIVANGLYLLIGLAQLAHLLATNGGRLKPRPLQVTYFVVDILAIVAIAHSSNITDSNLVLLLLPAIATANVFYSDLRGTFLAALATLLLLGDMLLQIAMGQQALQDLPGIAILGAVLFATAQAIHSLSKRSFAAMHLADIRADDIKQLESINQQIVDDLQTGVVVLGGDGTVRLANPLGAALLGLYMPKRNAKPVPAPSTLLNILQSSATTHYISGMANQELRVTVVPPDEGDSRLLFIEDLATLNEEAQQIKLASMGRLTASIAHEIRNPLGAISHAAQLLEESSLESSDHRLLQIVKEQSARLNRVVLNILEMTKQKQATPVNINLREWLIRFVEDFSLTSPDADINLEIEDLSKRNAKKMTHHYHVAVDPSHLHQIVVNLVNNGLRFSKKQEGISRITLALSLMAPDQTPRLDIIDYGSGVPIEDRQKIFEPFYTTTADGNGLGLYVCKQLCESNRIRIGYTLTDAGESQFQLNFEISSLKKGDMDEYSQTMTDPQVTPENISAGNQ